MGRGRQALPDLHQTREATGAEHRGGLHARPEVVRSLHPAHVRRAAGEGRGAHGAALRRMALRPRPGKGLAGPVAERREELLQLPAHQRPHRKFPGRIRPDAEVRAAPARRAHDRGDRPHHRRRGRNDPQGDPRRRDARGALLVRPARLGTHLAPHPGPLLRRGLHPRHRQGRQAATRPDQFDGPGADPPLPRSAAQRTGRRGDALPEQPRQQPHTRHDLHDPP